LISGSLAAQVVRNKHRNLEQHKKPHTIKMSASFATAPILVKMGYKGIQLLLDIGSK